MKPAQRISLLGACFVICSCNQISGLNDLKFVDLETDTEVTPGTAETDTDMGTATNTEKDTGTNSQIDTPSETIGLVSGGGKLTFANHRMTVTIGDVPASMMGTQSATYKVKLGVGPITQREGPKGAEI